ncbi:MAG: hypothetical protein LR015_05545 [Verrucomicrobia bacterium]|nr:hypothetical protein [Verrucomicrobiota bacterium]
MAIERTLSDYEDCGYRIGGPLVCGFIDWLAQQLDACPVDHILFLARDARIFHEVWKLRYASATVPTQYWLISRRALQMAVAQELNDDQLQFLASRMKGMTTAQIVASLHLRNQISDDSSAPLNEDQIKGLLLRLQLQLGQQAQQELLGMQRYLKSTVSGDHVALVDVGWHGTMQTLLQHESLWQGSRRPDISGYYLALLDAGPQRFGYCCDPQSFPSWLATMSQLVYFTEIFTAGDELSLIAFEPDPAGGCTPKFANQTLDPQQIAHFSAIRSGIMRFASEHPEVISREQAMATLLKSALYPDADLRHLLGNLRIGTFGESGSQRLLDFKGLNKAQWWPPALTQLLRTSLWPTAVWQALHPIHRQLAKHIAPAACQKITAALIQQ